MLLSAVRSTPNQQAVTYNAEAMLANQKPKQSEKLQDLVGQQQ